MKQLSFMNNHHLLPNTITVLPIPVEILSKAHTADDIIRRYTLFSAGAGFIPIPLLDTVTMIGIQYAMIRQLSLLYHIDFSEHQGKSFLAAILGSIGSISELKFIPGVGMALGMASASTMGAASAYVIGQIFKQHFDQGGTLLDFDPIISREYFRRELKKGRTYINSLTKNTQIMKNFGTTHQQLQQLLQNSLQHCEEIAALKKELQDIKAKKALNDSTNLKIIEGIGTKTEMALKKAGLQNWRQIAATEPYVIKELLDTSAGNFKLADPSSWPKQARLAMKGKFEELKQLQDRLIGGKA